MTNSLLHLCTDQDGIETWYEQTMGNFGPGFSRCQYRKDGKVIAKLPRIKLADTEKIKDMPEDQPE